MRNGVTVYGNGKSKSNRNGRCPRNRTVNAHRP